MTKQAVAPRTIFMTEKDFQPIDETRIYWLSSAGVMINSHGTTLMIDPLLEGFDLPLLVEMPILPKDVPSLDGVLITHCDNDHFSRLTISVVIAVVATGLMAVTKSIPGFYLLGAIRGLSTGMFSIVPLTIIINNWFEKSHGLATSIVFGFSGLAGSICSPILSSFIENFGWQTGYLIKAAIILGLCLPAVLYPFHLDPQKDGCLPYGHVEQPQDMVTQVSNSFSFTTVAFISFFVFGLLCSCITSVTQHLPGYGQSLGYSAALGAMLLSSGMVGNIISKLIIGVLSDHLGAIKATVTMIIANTVGIILLMWGSTAWLLIIGAFLFGSCYSIGAVALPLLTKYFFGIDNYARVFPKISFASNLGAAISLSMVGYIYDFFGSYLYAFIIALAMIAVCVITLTLTAKTKE